MRQESEEGEGGGGGGRSLDDGNTHLLGSNAPEGEREGGEERRDREGERGEGQGRISRRTGAYAEPDRHVKMVHIVEKQAVGIRGLGFLQAKVIFGNKAFGGV